MNYLRKILLALPLLLSTQSYASTTPFLGEVIWVGFGYCPPNWVVADGRLISLAGGTNNALFSLLGTQYGGDGKNTFAVPDLRGATAVGMGKTQADNFVIGQRRPIYGCPQGEECTQIQTSSLTLLPCIATVGYYPPRD